MLVKVWRFLTISLTALSMGLSVAHLFEMPVRLRFDPDLWVRVTVVEGIYRYFGMIGAVFEVGSALMAIALIFLVRKRGSAAYYFTLLGAICLVLALANWVVFVSTANVELARWLTNPIPPDFAEWRDQWEYGHAASAFIKIVGFGLLLPSAIFETPKTMGVESPESIERSSAGSDAPIEGPFE